MDKMDDRKKILLIDDFHLCRTFFAEGLRNHSGISVTEAADADGALKLAEEFRPDVIILNISMRHCSGIALLQLMCRKFPEIGLLAFSYLHHDHLYAERAVCAGACGYISVNEPGASLLDAVTAVASGGVYLSPPLRKKICMEPAGRGQKRESPFERLSHREFEVFCLTGYGHVPKRIADMLKVSVKTVETYRERIREKLGLTDGGELLYHATSFIREQSFPQNS